MVFELSPAPPKTIRRNGFGPLEDEAARYASAQRVLTAVALNLPYTDVEAVVDQVRATRIHETRETEANYVLAVYVKAYPCGVFSVWLYYGTQTRRNF